MLDMKKVQCLHYLEFDEEENIHLIQSHKYYYQIQTQLGVSYKKYTFCLHIPLIVFKRIDFNENLWTELADPRTFVEKHIY